MAEEVESPAVPQPAIRAANVMNPELPADVVGAKSIRGDGRRKDATLSPARRRWAEFFDHPSESTLERLATEDPIMADTVHKLSAVSDDDGTRRLAEARWEVDTLDASWRE